MSQVFAAWAIAPTIAGAFGAIIFLITKYGVLERNNPLRCGLWMIPGYFAVTAGVLTMSIVWKGAASLNLDDWGAGPTAGTIFGTSAGVVLLYGLFLLPYLYRRLVLEDWTLKAWEIVKGPLLWRRGEVPPMPEGHKQAIIQDYYRGHITSNTDPVIANEVAAQEGETRSSTMLEAGTVPTEREKIVESGNNSDTSSTIAVPEATKPSLSMEEKSKLASRENPWTTPAGFFARAKYYFFRGVNRDIVEEQGGQGVKPKGFAASFLAKDLTKYHKHVPHYDNKTEHLYSFLQVMTAAVASFGHGANDVSNAIGPLSAIFQIWQTNETLNRSEVPIWILAYGGAAISIGLWTYGYNMMRNLGNRLTLHSPSRGFSMELGAALTVVIATRLALPVSTTQCITGATVGVGLCSGTHRAINWRMILWIYMGWIITLPVAGTLSGCLMGIIINAPRYGLVD